MQNHELPNLPSPKATARRSRKSIRLKSYDYGQTGWYYITVCTQNREETLGKITEPGKMVLNNVGKMINKWWNKMFEKYGSISIDKYIIMPNHIHGIIEIKNNNVGAIPCNCPDCNDNIQRQVNDDNAMNGQVKMTRDEATRDDAGENVVSPLQRQIKNTYNGLGQYISWFKRMSTNEYIKNVKQNNWKPFDKQIWQRNYYEHIITSDKSYNNICEYIENNPYNWEDDRNNVF